MASSADSDVGAHLQSQLDSVEGEVVESIARLPARVLDNYFAGKPPFRGIGKRDDIPDALIWESVSADLIDRQ